MIPALAGTWPWYITGPLVGLVVIALLVIDNRKFGVSTSFRHICAATIPAKIPFFQYDWKADSWNLFFVGGMVAGGFFGHHFLPAADLLSVAEATRADLASLGINDHSGLVPAGIFSWDALLSFPGFLFVVVGGFCVGFGTRWAGGCTSGHAITGLAARQLPSLIAVLGFFSGGLFAIHVLFPLILGGGS